MFDVIFCVYARLHPVQLFFSFATIVAAGGRGMVCRVLVGGDFWRQNVFWLATMGCVVSWRCDGRDSGDWPVSCYRRGGSLPQNRAQSNGPTYNNREKGFTINLSSTPAATFYLDTDR